jgi:hypothetical protein
LRGKKKIKQKLIIARRKSMFAWQKQIFARQKKHFLRSENEVKVPPLDRIKTKKV